MAEPAPAPFVDDAIAAPAYKSILVPLDGSDLSSGALVTARALASRFGATIHAISIADHGEDVGAVRARCAQALGADPDDERLHVVAADDVPGTIEHQANELDSCLLCLSTHGRGRVAGALVGSVARALIERLEQPAVCCGPLVALADPEDESIPLRAGDELVACVDGSRVSERVLPVAAAWANALEMKLTIVTVAEPCLPPERPGAPWRRHHGPQTDADLYVHDLGEQWRQVAPHVEATVVYDPISPAAGLGDYLDDHPVGLLAMGSHLRAGLERLAFGATAAGMVHESNAPSLIAPLTSS